MASKRMVCRDCYHKGTDFVPDFLLLEPGVWQRKMQCPKCHGYNVEKMLKWSKGL